MDAEAFAGAAPKKLAVDRAGAAAIDAFFVLGPQEDALGAGIAFDHALGVVVGVMRQRFDGDVVAGIDLKLRLEQLAEIAPVHGIGIRRQIMIGRLARLGLRGRGRRKRGGAGPSCCRTTASQKCAFEEAAALAIEVVEQLLPMKLKIRAGVIVPCAHGRILLNGLSSSPLF